MGVVLCDCPLDEALPDIPISECPEGFGQIQKVVFQRIYSTGTTKNTFEVASADPTALASWTTFLEATDGTKAVVSPFIQGPTTEAGDAITYGGGNDTLGGAEMVLGRNRTSFSANMLNIAQATVKAMKALSCETLGVYLIDSNGKIGMLSDGEDTIANYYPIPVSNLFIGDKTLGGLEEPDMNAISWTFDPNWADDLAIITPDDFVALTDLAN